MKTSVVPCNGCTICCDRDAIFIDPELGDKVEDYQTIEFGGFDILDHKKDGTCIYLEKEGCSIYEKRPAVCREFDCRRFVERVPKKTMIFYLKRGIITKAALRRGKELLWRERFESKKMRQPEI